MDYLVFGVGFGSTLVLIGWVLRQFGPAFRYRNEPDDVLSAEQILERNDWQRFCIAMGALLSVCGAVILLVTLITLLIRPSDRVGTFVVGGLFVLAIIAVAAWVVMYVNQHRALAGDRRAEVMDAKATRKPAKPRPATAAEPAAGTTAGPRPTPAAAANVTPSAEGLDALDRRRRAAQQQRRPAGGASAAVDAAARTTTRPVQPSPASSDPAHTEREAADATSITTTTSPATPAAADPAQALRNVQFKRAGSGRAREEGAAAATTTTTTTTPAPVRPAVSSAAAPEGDDAGADESHQESSRDDA